MSNTDELASPHPLRLPPVPGEEAEGEGGGKVNLYANLPKKLRGDGVSSLLFCSALHNAIIFLFLLPRAAAPNLVTTILQIVLL